MGENEKQCPCAAMIKVQERLDEHHDRLGKGDTNFKVMDVKLDNISKDTQDIKADVKALTTKPAQK